MSTKCNKRKRRPDTWVVDSGASVHCIGDPSMLTTVYDKHPPVHIKVANNQIVTAHAVGTAVVTMVDTQGKSHSITLHNVVYHPSFHTNLMSVRRLWRDNRIGAKFMSRNILKCKHTGAKFNINYDSQYKMETVSVASVSLMAQIDDEILHRRFGHCSSSRLRTLKECSVNFPNHKATNHAHDPNDCDACQAGGMRRKSFHPRRTPFTYFGQRLSSDLCGPFPKSVDGYRYLLNIVDGHTNHLYIYLLRSKSSEEVRAAFDQFLRENKPYLPTDKPITWHTDNGGEFMSRELEAFCDEFAVKRSFSVPYAPPQNSHAERMWGIILRTIRISMAESGVHESFWSYAARHACMLHNILPSSSLQGRMTPYQAKFGMPPDVSKVRVWGCTVWYFLPEHERASKISPRAVPAVHLGCDEKRNGHLIYIPYLNRITTGYHLAFQERKFLKFTAEGIVNMPRNVRPLREVERSYRERRDDHDHNAPHDHNHDHDVQQPRAPPGSIDMSDEDAHEPSPRCSDSKCTYRKHSPDEPHSYEDFPARNRGRNTPRHASDHANAELIMLIEDVSGQALTVRTEDLLTDITTPDTYEQAIKSRHAERWKESMIKEITDLTKHGTWELVSRSKMPKSHRVIKSKWVYKIKLKSTGEIERFKSRFVACGYSQVKGVDYTHSFSATMRATSFRLLMALAAGEKMKLEHFDVTSAFTQADIDADIYVEPPKGFEAKDKHGNPMVLKLRKALYGTKQASRQWSIALRDHLVKKMGFANSIHDPCLYSKTDNKSRKIIVGVYVDDIILAYNGDKEVLTWFTKEFKAGFRASHLGPLSWFLGVSVRQGSDYKITLDQFLYIDKLMERFVPTNPGSVIKHAMPCNPITFQQLSTAKDDKERDKASRLPYLQLVGSLLYLSTMTRPDIAYHMSVLCSLMHDPSPAAYYAAIDLLLYVRNTKHLTLHFTGSMQPPASIDSALHPSISTCGGLVAYSDASWRRPNKLGYSMFGFVVYFYGAPVSFAAKNLKIIAMSSAEAEYAAAAYACKEIVFVRNVLSDLGFNITKPTVLAVDNKAAIQIAENAGVTGRNKHFSDTIHYFRHLVDHRVITPTYVPTTAQRADGFTKALGKGAFREWQRFLLRVPSE